METTKTSAFFDQISKIKRELIIGVLIIFVAGLGFAIYGHLEEKKEYTASQEYFAITKNWKNTEKPVENLNDESARAQLEAFLDKHKSTSSAISAAVLLADHYSSKDNEEKALSVLEKNAVGSPKSFVDALYLYRKSISLERLGKCDTAITVLDKLISAKHAIYLQADARLQKALCLEQVGKVEEAKVEYENVSKNFADTEAGKNAKKYLRLLDIGA